MKEIIIKYLQGTASHEEKTLLLTWLKEKEENKASFSEIRDKWIQENSGSAVSDPNYSRKAFQRFLKDLKQTEKKTFGIHVNTLFKVAASVAVLCLCAWGGYLMGDKQTVELPESVIINQLVMGKESKGSVVLPDGSTVWLNANSKLTYPEHFEANNRKVKLEGEGFFDILKDEKRPFYVEAGEMDIRVLGTKFDIQNYKDRGTLKTILLSGQVEASFPDRKERVILAPDQKITLDRETGEYHLSKVNAADYILWINDKLVCTNESLQTVLYKLRHWYGLDMVYDKNIPMQQRLSLTVRRETPEELFKVLELICPISCTVKNNTVYINPK